MVVHADIRASARDRWSQMQAGAIHGQKDFAACSGTSYGTCQDAHMPGKDLAGIPTFLGPQEVNVGRAFRQHSLVLRRRQCLQATDEQLWQQRLHSRVVADERDQGEAEALVAHGSISLGGLASAVAPHGHADSVAAARWRPHQDVRLVQVHVEHTAAASTRQ